MGRVHFFEDGREAYDACQCDGSIKTGDVLVIEASRVVGVAGCWPIAVTEEADGLHTLERGVLAGTVELEEGMRLEHFEDAVAVALRFGFPVRAQYLPVRGDLRGFALEAELSMYLASVGQCFHQGALDALNGKPAEEGAGMAYVQGYQKAAAHLGRTCERLECTRSRVPGWTTCQRHHSSGSDHLGGVA